MSKTTGYGQFTFPKKDGKRFSTSAHRAVWILTHGEPPAGMHVCHRCDVRLCINPNHLFLGTPEENTQDMISKGRRVWPSTKNRARGDRHPSKLRPGYLPVGEKHPQNKLKNEQVIDIRTSSKNGNELARLYGVTPVTISRIRRRLIWRHLP